MLERERETVELELRERVAWITLNRPDALNAVNPRMGRELLAAVERVAGDPTVRALVLTGAGRGFCSGADLRAVAGRGPDGTAELLACLDEVLHPLILRLRTIEQPVIAAVNGPAVGFGCSLALAADLVLAARSAYFLLAFTNVGLTLDGGASALLVARAGHGRACEMALLAEPIDADRALDWGLVNRVLGDDELLPAAAAMAGRLAVGPPAAHAAIKHALNRAAHPQLSEQLALEAAQQRERAVSADFSEGVRAFLEQRPAQFTGN